LYLLKALDLSDDEAAKNYCKQQGIQIVSFSVGYEGVNFGDGMAYSSFSPHPVTIVNDANANGILWVSAAGNEQDNQATISWRDSDLNQYLDWDSDYDYNELYGSGSSIPVGTEIEAFLTWNKWPVTNQDFDLFLYYWTGNSWRMLASSEETQSGSQPPSEWLSYTVTTAGTVAGDYCIFISKYSASSSPTFILRTFPYGPFFYGYDNHLTPSSGSIACPGDAAASFTVGAINCTNYASGPLEYYSSLGPNNGGYTGNPVVVKPDICGPAGVSTATYGDKDFYGTSAAAPHIAGLAALVKSAYPAYTSAQLKTYIQANGVDLGAAGKDNSYGDGPCVLPMPKQSLIVTTPYGNSNPPARTNWYSRGSSVAVVLTNSPVLFGVRTQYVCTGWIGTGSVPVSGVGTNAGAFTLTNNSSIAWQWATNYWLNTGTNGNGTVNQTDQWCRAGSNVVITATPAVSNRFSGWTGQTNGCAMSSHQITAPMTSSRQITANFVRQYSLAVSALYGEGSPSTGTNLFDSGTSVTVRMTNSPVIVGTTQYVCRGWIGTGSVPASGATTNAGPFAITNDSTITWLWKTNFWLDVGFVGSGSLSTGDCWVAQGSNHIITATSSNHWHFGSWSGDTNGCMIVSNRITVTMDRPLTIAATFEINRHQLIVMTAYGQANLPEGTNWFDYGSSNNVTITNSPVIIGGTQYVCKGWTRAGSVPASGTTTNTGMFALTNDCSVVWLWATNYWLHIDRIGSGSVSTSDVWIAKGTNVQVIATPGNYFSLGNWQGQTNGCTTSSNRITVAMDQPRNLVAVFVAEMATNAVPKWWLAQHNLTNFNADALQDIDFDGLKTWQEYIAGTDPTNSESCFRITLDDRNGIGWTAVSGRVYNVYWTTNLLTTGFQCMGSNIPWTQGGFTNPPNAPQGFYKMDVRMEE
jgi:hypothetical protein